jgi:hypothetical protein
MTFQSASRDFEQEPVNNVSPPKVPWPAHNNIHATFCHVYQKNVWVRELCGFVADAATKKKAADQNVKAPTLLATIST